MTVAREFAERFGPWGWVRFLFYPVTSLLTTPVRMAQTLWACRKLGLRWWESLQFNPHTGLDYLFYWIVAMNLSRYGRDGRCPHMGTGDLPMSRFFYHCAPSLYAYWKCGGVVVLLGMFGWWASQWIWLSSVNAVWVATVLGLALIGTTFYANTFALQNYNALGWMFFPFGLHGMMTGDWLAAGIAWLAMSFTSFTVTILAGMMSVAVALLTLQWWPILAMIPAGLKLSLHFRHFFSEGKFFVVVQDTAKSIGLTDRQVRYRRTASKTFGIRKWFYLALYLQFWFFGLVWARDPDLLFLAGILIFVVNASMVRFADEWSVHMLMLSLATAITIQHPDWPWLITYWLVASPPAIFAIFPSFPKVLDVVPPLAPFSIRSFEAEMEKFFEPVGEGRGVLMAFDSPGGVYEKLFDGYRSLIQLPLHVASKKKFRLMPDWWAVFETNREGAPEFWGRSPGEVRKNAAQWNAQFVMIYQSSGTELDLKWKDSGFESMGSFSWKSHEAEMGGVRPYVGDTPDWWLLKIH